MRRTSNFAPLIPRLEKEANRVELISKEKKCSTLKM